MTTAVQEEIAGLTLVEPATSPYINVLLYGPPKSGKTVGAASAPGPILYINADRPNATRFAHQKFPKKLIEAKMEGLDTLVAATQMANSDTQIETIVIDPIADVHRILLEEISGRALHPKIQEYGDVGTHLERFCRALCELPVHVVFVCHEARVKDEDTGGFERLPLTGTNNPAPAAKLMAMVDVIGYTGVVAGEGEGEPKYMAQLRDGRGRRGGDRFGVLGEAREVNISEWVDLARATQEEQQ